ncbi:MAG: hypothetical protein ACT4QC_04880 [Planctomycetaceae bacterium]
MSTQDEWPQREPQKQGMSTAAKVLLTLGVIGGICALLCCGGMFLVGWQFQKFAKNAMVDDPAAVRQRTDQIVTLEVPPGFEPKQAFDFVLMRGVVYTKGAGDDALLVLMEFGNQMIGNQQQQREQMRETLRQQQAQRGGGFPDLQDRETESREYTVKGEKASFEFVKGTTREGKAMREVSGSFLTQNGVAMLMLRVPAEEYDEAAVVKMIESIGDPHQPGEVSVEQPVSGDAQAPANDPAVEAKPD